MSKKTKKEKILAAYRKKLRLLELSNKQSQSLIDKSDEPASLLNLEVKEQNKKIMEIKKYQPNPLLKYFFLDLRKSLILVIFIIALEFSLYFVKLIK